MVFQLKWICQEIVDGGGLKFIHDILLNHRSEAELGRTLFTAILLYHDFPRQFELWFLLKPYTERQLLTVTPLV